MTNLVHQQEEVCHLLHSSMSPLTGFLCTIGWRITGFLQTPPLTNSIPNSQSCVIITFRCYVVKVQSSKFKVICAHAYTWR